MSEAQLWNKGTHLWKIHGIIDKSQSDNRHLSVRLSLQQKSKDSTPIIVSTGISGDGITLLWLWTPANQLEVEAAVTFI